MPKNRNFTRYQDFEAELLGKPGIRKEYDALKRKYDLVRTIIERRNQLQISQSHLARIVGTRQPAISRLEKGDSNTTLSTLFEVADALDLDIALRIRPATSLRAKRGNLVQSQSCTRLLRRYAPRNDQYCLSSLRAKRGNLQRSKHETTVSSTKTAPVTSKCS